MRRAAIAVLLCASACTRSGGGNNNLEEGEAPRVTVGERKTVATPQLPPWFGDAKAPPVRIAGQVWADDVPGHATVHLRIAAADPTVWSGVDRETGTDGVFDLGVSRAGAYVAIATARGRTSRVTTVPAHGVVALYTYPCTDTWREVLANGRPIEGARVDIAGVVVATTDERGRFSLCAGGEPIAATIRAPGFAPERLASDTGAATIALAPAGEIAGDVFDPTGRPAKFVAIRAIPTTTRTVSGTGDPISSAGEPFALQATTDAFGRFTLANVPRGVPVNFQIATGDSLLTDRTTTASALVTAPDTLCHVQIAYATDERPRSPAAGAIVRGTIVHAGRPLPDARVAIAGAETRTGRDGTFELAVPEQGRAIVTVDHPRGLATARTIAIYEPAFGAGVVPKHPPARPDVLLSYAPRRLDIELAPTGTIAGTIADATGTPLRGSVHLVARDTAVDRTVVVTNGHFTFPAVELGGTYTLEATSLARRATVEVSLDDSLPNVTGLALTLQ